MSELDRSIGYTVSKLENNVGDRDFFATYPMLPIKTYHMLTNASLATLPSLGMVSGIDFLASSSTGGLAEVAAVSAVCEDDDPDEPSSKRDSTGP